MLKDFYREREKTAKEHGISIKLIVDAGETATLALANSFKNASSTAETGILGIYMYMKKKKLPTHKYPFSYL